MTFRNSVFESAIIWMRRFGRSEKSFARKVALSSTSVYEDSQVSGISDQNLYETERGRRTKTLSTFPVDSELSFYVAEGGEGWDDTALASASAVGTANRGRRSCA
jgi:hypothetical protein